MRFANAWSSTGSRRPGDLRDSQTIPGQVGKLISCKDASRLISQMQDGNVPLRQWLRIRLHLLFCEACKRFEQQLRFLHHAMERYRQ